MDYVLFYRKKVKFLHGDQSVVGQWLYTVLLKAGYTFYVSFMNFYVYSNVTCKIKC